MCSINTCWRKECKSEDLGLGSESAAHKPGYGSISSPDKRARKGLLFPTHLLIPSLWLPGALNQHTPLMSTRGQHQSPGNKGDSPS